MIRIYSINFDNSLIFLVVKCLYIPDRHGTILSRDKLISLFLCMTQGPETRRR